MKNINEIAFLVQSRLNSERVPRKMIKDFAGTTLSDLILEKLVKSKIIPNNQIYFSVFEDELVQIGKKYPINIFERSFESANCDKGIDVMFEWYNKLPFKYVVLVSGCNPLLKIETIDKFIQHFIEQKEENLFGVIKTKDYYWNKEGKLVTPWPKDQTLMNTKAVEVTYKAAHVLYASRIDLIKDDRFMGDFQKEGGIKLYPIDELECFDIDYEWQFELGKKLYND